MSSYENVDNNLQKEFKHSSSLPTKNLDLLSCSDRPQHLIIKYTTIIIYINIIIIIPL